MTRKLLLSILLLCLAQASHATRDYHYGAVTDENVLRCDQRHWQGEVDSARKCYQALVASNASAFSKAEAWWALGDAKQANEFFKTASKQQPDDSMVLTRWGDLFVSTHQLAEAQKLYSEALALDKQNNWAALGTGIVLSDSYDPAGKEHLEKLQEQQDLPEGVRLKVTLVAALAAIENSETVEAADYLQLADKIAKENKLPRAEIFATQAGLAVRNRQPSQDWIDKALDENPAYGDAYAIPAHIYMITFRYDETGEYYQKAVDVQPDHWEAHLELGANHLRQNRGKEARTHFTLAYEGDPFNPAIVNSLRMIDTYDTFTLHSYPSELADRKIPVVTLRLDPKEADVLAPYVERLGQDAIKTLSKRYQYDLKNTATIEVYPNHEDFVVRTLGMPGMALLGVAFGDVIALDSPSAQAGNDYHWGTTLWHEIAHIFTLKASDHNVPRWFTEGISVFEEWRTGPIPGIRIPNHVWQSLREHEFLPIAELDQGFVRPSYDNQVIVSYMQGGLICEFLETEYSFEKLLGILNAYKQGMNTAQAIEKVMQMTTAQFDKEFEDFYNSNFAHFAKELPEFGKQLTEAMKSFSAEDYTAAVKFANEAIKMRPEYIEADSPYLTKASAQKSLEQHAEAMQTLLTYWQRGGYQPEPLLELARYTLEQKDPDTAVKILYAYNLVDPFNIQVHQLLGDTLLEKDQAEDALREYQVAMALNPLDQAAAWFQLASANHKLGNHETAREQVLESLDKAPHYRPAQKLLRTLLTTRTTQE